MTAVDVAVAADARSCGPAQPAPGRRAALRRAAASGTVRRAAFVYLAFRIVELGAWIAVTIHAHERGGVREASAVMVAELVPAVVVAAFVGQAADRWGRRRVLTGGLALQAASLGVLLAGVAAGAPWWAVYGAAVAGSAAMVTTRPTVVASLPTDLDPAETTAVHSVLGWFDGVALLTGPAVVALALGVGDGDGSAPFAVLGVVALAALSAARGLPVDATEPPPEPSTGPASAPSGPVTSVGFWPATRAVVAAPGAVAALVVLAAQALLVGTLDLLAVVAAIDVLGGAPSLAGWLSAAFGAGALLGGAAGIWFCGRRQLWPVIAAAGVVAAAASTVIGTSHSIWLTAPAFAGCGLAVTLLLVASRSILQRMAPPGHLCHAFALAEAAEMAMLLAGVALVPLLARCLDGAQGAVVVGLVVAVVLAIAVRDLAVADRPAHP